MENLKARENQYKEIFVSFPLRSAYVSAPKVKEAVQAGEKELESTENSFNDMVGVIKGNITDIAEMQIQGLVSNILEIGTDTEKVSRHAGILNNTANELQNEKIGPCTRAYFHFDMGILTTTLPSVQFYR